MMGPWPLHLFWPELPTRMNSLRSVNQCPGGVSESGPSAQNSAMTLP